MISPPLLVKIFDVKAQRRVELGDFFFGFCEKIEEYEGYIWEEELSLKTSGMFMGIEKLQFW